MTPTVRLLPLDSLPGPANMAADEALLESAAERGVASLRFYTWSEPTLSLGYFQSSADRFADPLLTGLPWVRRATGGTALVHDHEITYALALPADLVKTSRESWACRFHKIVTEALSEGGAETRAVQLGEEAKLGAVLCFLHQTAGDLLAGPAKVVGSAQRKCKGALLQHGGILLARSRFTPQLPGLLERTGRTFPAEQVASLVSGRFTADTGWPLVSSDWTPVERTRREQIEAEKYVRSEWNEKR